MTLTELLAQLHAEGRLESARLEAGVPLPPAWYIRLLSALGAWLSTVFFLGFWLALVLESPPALLLTGLCLCAASAWLMRKPRFEFIRQLSLANWLTGACLTAWSVSEIAQVDGFTWLAGALLILSALYPEALGRTLTAILAGLVLVVQLGAGRENQLLCEGLTLALAVLGGALWLGQASWWRRGLGPWASSYARAALVTMLFVLFQGSFGWREYQPSLLPGLGLTLAVLWLAARLVHRLSPAPGAGLAALLTTLVTGLLTLATPGVTASLGLLLLGQEVNSRRLIGLAWVCLLAFVSKYYYDLNVMLLTKALALCATGSLLLLARRELVRR